MNRLASIIWARSRRASWSPALLGAASLWLDAADDRAITITGSGVSAFANKAGSGGTALQGTDALRPTRPANILNGLPALRCASQWLAGTLVHSGSALSMFAVLNMQSGATSGARCFGMSATAAADGTAGGVALSRNAATQAIRTIINATGVASIAITYNTPFLVGHVISGTGISARINGGAEVTAALTPTISTNNYAVGVNSSSGGAGVSFWSNDIHEILVFPATLGDDARFLVEGYLGHKWWAGSILPSDHRYKNAAP